MMNMEQEDRKDWINYCNGNQSAIEKIYRRHKDNMYTYCFYITGDRQISEDIVQETFVKLLKSNQKNRKIQSIKNWLFICARNLIFNYLKKNNRVNSNLSQIQNVTDTFPPDVKLFVERILNKLTPDERDLILLREYHQYPINEISSFLEISEEAVRVRLYRIRKKMRQLAKE